MTNLNKNDNVATALLQMKSIGDNHFRNCYNQDNQLGMMFGGQLLAQGLAAAQQTVPPWAVHNCNAYFPSPGSSKELVEYHVEIIRDGRRFANRRVVGSQGDKQILDMLCSFHDPKGGPEHQHGDLPNVAPPEALLKEQEFIKINAHRLPDITVAALSLPFPVETCVVDADKIYLEGCNSHQRNYWFRMPSASSLTEDAQQSCILAFLSDYRLGAATLAPHLPAVDVDKMIIATLNHSMWFHRTSRTDEWLLFVTDSPWASEGRGLARGSIYNRSGQLVASAVQELMVGIR